MDAARLASLSNYGYGKAASIIGVSYQQFRPTTALNPLAEPAIATLFAAFDQDGTFGFKKPWAWDPKKAQGYALIDATNLLAGDYLVGPDTYFVDRVEGFRPTAVVMCNRIVSISVPSGTAPSENTAVGFIGYDAVTKAEETTTDLVATGWPVALREGTRGETDAAKLPGDVRTPWWSVLMPNVPGVLLGRETVLIDDRGISYQVSSAEQTNFGWRLTCLQNET